MFVMQYDMEPDDSECSVPRTQNTNVAAVFMEPDTDIEVEISPSRG